MIFVLFVFYSFGMKEDNYFEYTWGKSIVLAMSALTQRGTESGTPDSIGARISFFMYQINSKILIHKIELICIYLFLEFLFLVHYCIGIGRPC